MCLQPLGNPPHELGDIGQSNGVETRVLGNCQSTHSRQTRRRGRRNHTGLAGLKAEMQVMAAPEQHAGIIHGPASSGCRGGEALATCGMEPRRLSRWLLPCGSFHGWLVQPGQTLQNGASGPVGQGGPLTPRLVRRLAGTAGGDGCPAVVRAMR